MNSVEKGIRSLRKRTKSWIAGLAVNAAKGSVDIQEQADRLQSVLSPLVKPRPIQEALSGTSSNFMGDERVGAIKKRVMSRLTPAKLQKRMQAYPLANPTNLGRDTTQSVTLGRMLITWAVLTNQTIEEFIPKINSSVRKLYTTWRDTTGCAGLSDAECTVHPRESAQFWSGFWRTLISATPENNLLHLMQTGTGPLAQMMGQPGVEDEIDKLLQQATVMIATQTAQKITNAFEANPKARAKAIIPELQALVVREEIRLGWSKANKDEAVNTLEKELSAETKKTVGYSREVISRSLESVGRKGLYNNLCAALDNRLRPLFLDLISKLVDSIRRVKTSWDFTASHSLPENVVNIQAWLFRRQT